MPSDTKKVPRWATNSSVSDWTKTKYRSFYKFYYKHSVFHWNWCKKTDIVDTRKKKEEKNR
jgi:hypothetical protein